MEGSRSSERRGHPMLWLFKQHKYASAWLLKVKQLVGVDIKNNFLKCFLFQIRFCSTRTCSLTVGQRGAAGPGSYVHVTNNTHLLLTLLYTVRASVWGGVSSHIPAPAWHFYMFLSNPGEFYSRPGFDLTDFKKQIITFSYECQTEQMMNVRNFLLPCRRWDQKNWLWIWISF